MNIANLFQEAFLNWPQRIAIIDKDNRKYTYSELRHLVEQQVLRFKNRGISKKDRVMVLIPMSIELYVSVLALFNLGAIAVFLDEWVSKDRLDLCCKMANCKGFIAPLKIRMLALTSKELRKINYWFKSPVTSIKAGLNLGLVYPSNPNDTALITFTTGSTGIPKAANRTHAFLKAQFDALLPLTDTLPNYPTGPDMPMLPIVLLVNLGRGITSVIADFKASKPLKFNPKKVWNQIQEQEVVSLTTSPYYAQKLSETMPLGYTRLQRMRIGGAAVFPNLVERLNTKLPNTEIVIVYGSTEAEPISHISGHDFLEFHQKTSPLLGVYVGIPDQEISVVIHSFDFIPEQPFRPMLYPNEPGEICVSGKHVLTGYIDNPVADKQNKIWVSNTCWHRTGDAGFIDKTGRLFLLGRCNQIIKHKSLTYFPFLMECFLQSLPGILCGTVVLKNESLYAIIQVQTKCNRIEIEKEIKNHISAAILIFVNKIPMDPRHNSKIDYEQLMKLILP